MGMALPVDAVAPVIGGRTPPTVRQRSTRYIGDVVVELGFADRRSVEKAIVKATQNGRRTGQVLVEDGTITSDELARVIAERFGVDHLDLSIFKVDMTA